MHGGGISQDVRIVVSYEAVSALLYMHKHKGLPFLRQAFTLLKGGKCQSIINAAYLRKSPNVKNEFESIRQQNIEWIWK